MFRRFAGSLVLLAALASAAQLEWGGVSLGLDYQGGLMVDLSVADPDDVDHLVGALRDRISAMDFDQPLVVRRGEDQVRIEVSDPGMEVDVFIDRLGGGPPLEFLPLMVEGTWLDGFAREAQLELRTRGPGEACVRGEDREELGEMILQYAQVNPVPEGVRITFYDQSGEVEACPVSVEPIVAAGGLTDVSVESDESHRPYISIVLDEQATVAFGEWTGGHVGQTVVVALGDEIVVAPVIQGAITEGEIRLDLGGIGPASEAFDLAARIEQGAIPVDFTVENAVSIAPAADGFPGPTTLGMAAWIGVAVLLLNVLVALRLTAALGAVATAFALPVAIVTQMGGVITRPAVMASLLIAGAAMVIMLTGLFRGARTFIGRMGKALPGWVLAAVGLAVSYWLYAGSVGWWRGFWTVGHIGFAAILPLTVLALGSARLPRAEAPGE